jgi:hypothetical protein
MARIVKPTRDLGRSHFRTLYGELRRFGHARTAGSKIAALLWAGRCHRGSSAARVTSRAKVYDHHAQDAEDRDERASAQRPSDKTPRNAACKFTKATPQLADSSGALASRFIIFNTRRSFYGEENPHLFLSLLLALAHAQRTRQAQRKLDDRFHRTGAMEPVLRLWIPRLRLGERGTASWRDGGRRSNWR